MQIYIDMDGTICNYHDRFYFVYSYACCKVGEAPLSQEEWIKYRKKGIPTYTKEIHEKLSPVFEELFESRESLAFDRLIPGMSDVILKLQDKYKIYIVSFRANEKNLINQLNEYGITNFKTIIQGFSSGFIIDEKANMIKKVVPNPCGWIVGDSQYEISVGKKLGLKTIAVSWGDKDREFLEKYNPNFIVDSPNEILSIIK